MVSFVSNFFSRNSTSNNSSKSDLEKDLDYISACDEEVDTDELRDRMHRVKREIELESKQDERKLAMKVAQQCVYDSKKWRKVFNGLRLLDVILDVPILQEEQRNGRYFDVIMQCSLLEKFTDEDKRITYLVQKRARGVKQKVLDLIAGDINIPTVESSNTNTNYNINTDLSASEGAATGGGSESQISKYQIDSNSQSNVNSNDSNSNNNSRRNSGKGISMLSNQNPFSSSPDSVVKSGQAGRPHRSNNVSLGVNYYQSNQKRGAQLTNSTGSTLCYTKHTEDTDSEEDEGGPGPSTYVIAPSVSSLAPPPPPPNNVDLLGADDHFSNQSTVNVDQKKSTGTTVTDLIDL